MKKYLFIILIQVFCLNLGAQEKLKGRVIDAQSQEPLAGAVIKVKNPVKTAITNNEGYFELSLPQGSYQLQVQYLGYAAREIPINIPVKETVIIALTATDNSLNEVQVIGYGQTTKRLSTGSIASINAKDIERQPVTNILSALSGRMPGVMVQTTNGLPGGNINVQIRGKGSIAAGTDPLYIIDGVPFDGSAPNPNNDLQTNSNISGAINPLNSLNPADIESITVLKDADATAIYGSRGSNGVIVITTQKAKTGNAQFDITAKAGASNISQRPKVLGLTDYLSIRRLAYQKLGQQPSDVPSSANYAPDLTIWSQEQETDWIDYLYGGNAPYGNLQVSTKSSNKVSSVVAGANFHNEGAITPGKNHYQRVGLFLRIGLSSNDQKFQLMWVASCRTKLIPFLIWLTPQHICYLQIIPFIWKMETTIHKLGKIQLLVYMPEAIQTR